VDAAAVRRRLGQWRHGSRARNGVGRHHHADVEGGPDALGREDLSRRSRGEESPVGQQRDGVAAPRREFEVVNGRDDANVVGSGKYLL
jgi:hypothetical protein